MNDPASVPGPESPDALGGRFSRFRSRLVLFFLCVLLIPSILLPLLGLGYLYRQSLRTLVQQEVSQARQHSRLIETKLESIAMEALMVSGLPEVRTLANADTPAEKARALAEVRDRLQTYLIRHGEFASGIRLADVSGSLLLDVTKSPAAATPPAGPPNQADRPWFTGANHLASIRGKKIPVYYSHPAADQPVRFSTVVENDRGELFGALALEIDLDLFIRSLPATRFDTRFVLLNETGDPLTERPEGFFSRERENLDLNEILRRRWGVVPADSRLPASVRIHTRIQPPAQSNIRWTLLTDVPLTGLGDSFGKTVWIGVGVTLASVLVALAIASRLSRQISDPVLRLAEAADDVTHGHWDTRAPESRHLPQEIRQLGHAFNSMCRQLKTSQESLLQNVEELKASRENLSRESRRLSVLLQSIGDAVVAVDLDGRIQLANAVAEKLLGVSPGRADNRPLAEIATFLDPASEEDITTQLVAYSPQAPRVHLNELRLINHRREEHRIEHTLAPIRIEHKGVVGQVLVLRDVTRIRQAAEQRERLERMESLGILAGGIAHDFNNLLAVILGDLSLLATRSRENAPETEWIDHAQCATQRARELTRQLMTFSKGGMPIKQTSCLRTLLDEAARLVLRGSECNYQMDADDALWKAEVDPTQIHQVFHNLLLNAAQAMPQGGTIRIRLSNEHLTEEPPDALPPGLYVKIILQDEGTGIPPQHLPHIFDPYYTTKETGHGLGLSSAHRIVTTHGGHIEVDSTRQGTRFTLLLPALEPSDTPPEPSPSAPGNPAVSAPPSRILLLDDDEGIRRTCTSLLKHLGHHAEAVADGDQALARYREARAQGTPYDLLILDLTIPGGKGGRYVIEHIRREDADIKAVVSSGYSQDEVMARHQEFGFDAMIRKPYTLQELSHILQTTLSHRRNSP